MNYSKQNGQAIVYIVVLVGVLALAIAYVFNSLQIVNEKTRLQNTVDAAAYSVAIIEARGLNFNAYTNRAMVANHAAIAQAVSLTSWVRFLEVNSKNISRATSVIPYVGSTTDAIEGIVGEIKETMEPILQAAATAIDTSISLLQTSQHLMQGATLVVAEETLNQVVSRNDPDVDKSISLSDIYLLDSYVKHHNDFVRRFDPEGVRRAARGTKKYEQNKARLDEFRNITLNSTDGFTRERNEDIPVIPVDDDGFPIQWDIRRAGGTTLVGENNNAPYGSWVAMDTLSIHSRIFSCDLSGCDWRAWREIKPVGWGAAKNARGSENIRFKNYRNTGDYRKSWKVNPAASNKAARTYQGDKEVESGSDYLGLRSFYDLSLDGLLAKGPGVKLILTKPAEKIRTTSQLGTNSGSLDIGEGGMSGNKLAAFSHASAYFSRINDDHDFRRNAGVREYGNLYNPYWQARLVRIADADKAKLQLIAQKY